MASLRQMRRSGLSSDASAPAKDVPHVRKEMHQEKQNGSDLGEWEEPPLRAPAPSFEDYKGLERHGVLEHMAPLGQLPGQKVKARMRQYEPPRRTLNLKNGEARAVGEELSTPEPPPPNVTKHLESRKESRPLISSSSKEREDGQSRAPALAMRITPVKASPTTPIFNGNPPAHTPIARARLGKIVDSAAKRSKDLGDPGLGLAIKRLYEESNHDHVLADLLDAVLSKNQTPQQITDFQVYIKAARKQLKHGDDRAKRSSLSKSESKSPGKSRRASVVRQLGTVQNSHNAPVLSNPPPPSHHSPSKVPSHLVLPSNMSSTKDRPPSKRVKRSGSASSTSSLSSIGSDIEEFAPNNVGSTLTTAADRQISPKKSSQSHVQPGAGLKLGSFSTNRYYDPNRPPIGTYTQPPNETADEIASRKRGLQNSFKDYRVDSSNLRDPPSPARLRQPVATPPRIAAPSSQRTLRNGVVNRSRQYDDDEDSPLSSPEGLLLPPSMGSSRAGTPNRLGRPSKAVKSKAARIKMSPLKKRNGVTAGIARPADADSIPSYGRDDSQHGNSDVCAACSGNGTLLCCDGCDRAFHFSCCDPPLSPEHPPSGAWFCYVCMKDRAVIPDEPRGIVGVLGTYIKTKNPIAFNLPSGVRDYFEGVKAGDEGEYEEVYNIKANKARAGYEEQPNNFKLRDSKDNAVLCFRCSKSSMGQREIIGCDFCNLSWHLDCLDPPLAGAPNKYRANSAKPRHSWMCPNHVDSELQNLEASGKVGPHKSKAIDPISSRRKLRIRRPKEAKIIDIGLRRGFKNNGLIEIENETSEEEDEKEQEMSGGIYRVPERGIKLDFIDRVKRSNLEAGITQRQKFPGARGPGRTQPIASNTPHGKLDKLPFTERKAALNLAQLAKSDVSLNPDKVKNLIDTLVAEAPTNVETLVTTAEKAPAPSPTDQERTDLQALIALATRRLHGSSSSSK